MLKLFKNTEIKDEALILEASVERERVKKFMNDNLGKDYFDKYLKIRDRLTDPNLKDFNKIIKLDPEDVKVAIDRYDSASSKASQIGGKEKVGENSDWVVYHVTSFPAAQELGEGTKWCITGRYGNMDPNDDHYFNDYISRLNLDGGYYFYIPKDGSNNKYCLLLTKNGKIDSIWETPNGQIYSVSELNFPEVKGIDLENFEGDTLDNLYTRLDQAYNDDDSDEWSYLESEISERGGYVDFPDPNACISENKPNIFNMLFEWGWTPQESDVVDMVCSVYEDRYRNERSGFMQKLGDYLNPDTNIEIFGRLDGDDKSEFFVDYSDSFTLHDLIDSLSLSVLNDWISESWFDNSVNWGDFVENYYEEPYIIGILSDLGIEDANDVYMDYANYDFLDFLKHLDDSGVVSFDPAFQPDAPLNLKAIIDEYGVDTDNSELQELLDGLFSLGARLTKDEAKELMKEIDSIEDFDNTELVSFIQKHL